MNSTSESLLVRLSAPDDSDAWSRFVQLYTPLIFYWARKTGLQAQDASDLVQDVMAIVLGQLPQFKYDPEKSFRGWLRTITMNQYRQLCRRKRPNLVDANGSLIGNLADQRQAESTWNVNYARQLVAAAMAGMQNDFAPQTWNALKKLLQTGQPAADIARETGVSVWTIYAAKSRLMKRLRSELDGLLD